MKFPTIPRQVIGIALMAFAVGLSVYAGYSAHQESQALSAEASRLSVRQDIMFAAQDSDRYPLVVEDGHRKILIWNRAIQELTGYTKEEIERLGIPAIIADSDTAQKHEAAVLKALADKNSIGKVTIIHGNLKTKTGKVIPVRVSVYVFQSLHDGRFALARINPESCVREVKE